MLSFEIDWEVPTKLFLQNDGETIAVLDVVSLVRLMEVITDESRATRRAVAGPAKTKKTRMKNMRIRPM